RSRRGRCRCARACQGSLSRWWGTVAGWTAEVDAAGAVPLELVETVERGHGGEGIERPPGVLALRRRRDDGAEVRGALAEGGHRGAHVVAHAGDGVLVGGAQRRVGLVARDRSIGLDEGLGQTGVREGCERRGTTVLVLAAHVVPLAPRRVPAGERLVALGAVD